MNLFSHLHCSYIIIWRKIKWSCTNPGRTKLIFASPEHKKIVTRFRDCKSQMAWYPMSDSLFHLKFGESWWSDLISHRSWKQGTLWNSLTLHKCMQHNSSHGETVMWLIMTCCETPELMSPRTTPRSVSKRFALAWALVTAYGHFWRVFLVLEYKYNILIKKKKSSFT